MYYVRQNEFEKPSRIEVGWWWSSLYVIRSRFLIFKAGKCFFHQRLQKISRCPLRPQKSPLHGSRTIPMYVSCQLLYRNRSNMHNLSWHPMELIARAIHAASTRRDHKRWPKLRGNPATLIGKVNHWLPRSGGLYRCDQEARCQFSWLTTANQLSRRNRGIAARIA